MNDLSFARRPLVYVCGCIREFRTYRNIRVWQYRLQLAKRYDGTAVSAATSRASNA